MSTKSKALKGYEGRDSISHRKYSRKTSINRMKRTGNFTYKGTGSGHRAGEMWGESKGIDPNSRVMRYSKNSPSFDEGVYQYKAKQKVLDNLLK